MRAKRFGAVKVPLENEHTLRVVKFGVSVSIICMSVMEMSTVICLDLLIMRASRTAIATS